MQKQRRTAVRWLALIVIAAGVSFGLLVSHATHAKNQSKSQEKTANRDWPMWGGSPSRNMANPTTGLNFEFELEDKEEKKPAKRINWTARLGSQTYGNPVISGGKVFVGTNNGGRHRPKHQGDRGCVLAFDIRNGKLLWQLTRQKLPIGKVNDWPEQGICSAPVVEGDRMYLVTNRAELICLDTEGFHDGQNDGPYKDEDDKERMDADIVWILDMIDVLGVFPHNLATSSPVMHEELVYLVTSNGVDEAHAQAVSPRSPSFIAVNKKTGKVTWEDGSPESRILHGQWSSPSVGIVNGQAQVFFAGGDGWLYALEAKTGKQIWRCDLNPKDSTWKLGGRGTRNNILSTPVFINNSVFVGVGQDPDHGNGVGHLYRIDATKTGDVSRHLIIDKAGKPLPLAQQGKNIKAGQKIVDNPNSAVRWHYGGFDNKGEMVFRRTMSTCAVYRDMVFVADLTGFVHCLDAKTGRRIWEHDLLAEIWGSPMVIDGRLLIGTADGDLYIMSATRKPKVLKHHMFPSAIFSTPTIANRTMYISNLSRLFSIDLR